MKAKKLIGLCLGLVLVAMSCSKDSDSIIDTKMGAKIDGNSWSSITRVSVMAGETITITGTSTADVMVITINGITAKTYTLSIIPVSTECACVYQPSLISGENDWYYSTSGTVTLTKVDTVNKKISGTFQFTVAKGLLSTKSITSGVFNDLSYTTGTL